MNFTEFFIRRPAFTIVFMLMMTIIGMMSYNTLPMRWIPNVTPPIVSIHTTYAGASASLVESAVTTPIEAALSGVDGVEQLVSSSRRGESNITLNFKLGRNLDTVIQDVRSSLTRISGSLPHDVDFPVISKADADDMAILYLAFSDPGRTAKEVSDYVEQFITPRLQTVDGVAMVADFGMRGSAMRIWLDPAKMAASNVTVNDIEKMVAMQNVEVPSGQIRGKDRFYNVVTNQTLNSAQQFNDLILREDKNQIVRLKNVAEAEVAPQNMDSAFRVQGQPAVALGIIPQSNANPLDVSRDVLNRYKEITHSLPQGMQASIVYNEASFIRDSVHSVYEALIEAVLFVLIVVFLFLGSWRATLIPVVTIPVCLITTFALLFFFKFSINTITLMAFVLAIGLVVDDAIVMLENVARHIESGMKPFDAAIKGSREIIFPIIAMTLTLAAVYTPIAFTTGLLGSVFREFAVTLAGAVLISGLVALTLSPMMCARLLLPQQKTGRYAQWLSQKLFALQTAYRRVLTGILTERTKILLLLSVIIFIGCGIYRALPSELAPMEDRDEIDVFMSAPHDASFTYTDSYVKQLEAIYSKIPEVASYLAMVGGGGSPSFSFQILNLKPWHQRHRSAQQIVDALNEQFEQIPGVRVTAAVPPPPLTSFGGGEGGGNKVSMSVMSSGDYKDLHASMQQLLEAAKKYPGFTRVDSQLKWDRDEFEVNIDREKAADLNVPMQNITDTISTFLAGRNVGKFEYGGKQYDIIMQLNQLALSNPNIIPQFYVKSENNTMVSLSDLATMRETSNPGSLPHFERLRSDTVFAGLAPGYTIADAVTTLEKMAKQILPDNAKVAFLGEARNYKESSNKMLMTFLLALVFIYLVLVAQFESFIDPFVILLTVPFAVIGALLTLLLMGGSLNIYSNIGLVTLIGLIAKHGILMTEFANQACLAGMSVQDAIVEAAVLRLRPILMTTAAMILGAMPLALAFGPGSETRHQVGWVIVGGLFFGTFFSLVVVPVAYTYLAKWKKSSRDIREKIQPIFETEAHADVTI